MISKLASSEPSLRAVSKVLKQLAERVRDPNTTPEILNYIADDIVQQAEALIMVGQLTDKARSSRTSSQLAPLSRTELIVLEIVDYVAEQRFTDRISILGPIKTKDLVRARHISIWLARTITPASLHELGRIFSRDHTSILAGFKSIERQRQGSHELQSELNAYHDDLTLIIDTLTSPGQESYVVLETDAHVLDDLLTQVADQVADLRAGVRRSVEHITASRQRLES